MKFAVGLAALILNLSLHAAPVGNTAAPELIHRGFFTSCDDPASLRLGYEGNFVADGRMEQFDGGSGRVDCYEQDANSGSVTLNFLNRIDLFGVFGASQAKANWRVNYPDGIVQRIKLDTLTDFIWSAGGRAILYQWYNTFLGFGGRYSSSDYDPSSLTVDGNEASVTGTFCRWREWQINLDLSYKIRIFTPYIGVKYSNAQTHLGNFSVPIAANGSGSTVFKNRDPVGLYLGCTLSNGKYAMLNLEGRLIDEEAITVSADLRF